MLYACLKRFKWSKFKNPKGCKKPKKRWWVFSKWSGGLEKKCMGGWVFTIFFWWWSFSGLGIWIVVVERGGNFGTLWKLVDFFCQASSCIFLFFISFDNDVTTSFKEGVVRKRTIFFVVCILGMALLIFVAIIIVVEHLSCCCDCFGNKLKKKYVGKMSATKMSYL